MNFSEFTEAVDKSLTVDAERRATSDFKKRQILNAIWDLQFHIKAFRDLGRTLIPFEEAGRFKTCGSVNLSSPRKIEHVAVVFHQEGFDPDDPTSVTYKIPCCRVEDENAYELKHLGEYTSITDLKDGTELVRGFSFYHDTLEEKLYYTPNLTINQSVEILWDSHNYEFADTDVMPWFPDAVEAVALWVKAFIHLEVNEDDAMHLRYLGHYYNRRTKLFLKAKEDNRDLSRQRVVQLQNYYVRPTSESFDDPGDVILFDPSGEPITISF